MPKVAHKKRTSRAIRIRRATTTPFMVKGAANETWESGDGNNSTQPDALFLSIATVFNATNIVNDFLAPPSTKVKFIKQYPLFTKSQLESLRDTYPGQPNSNHKTPVGNPNPQEFQSWNNDWTYLNFTSIYKLNNPTNSRVHVTVYEIVPRTTNNNLSCYLSTNIGPIKGNAQVTGDCDPITAWWLGQMQFAAQKSYILNASNNQEQLSKDYVMVPYNPRVTPFNKLFGQYFHVVTTKTMVIAPGRWADYRYSRRLNRTFTYNYLNGLQTPTVPGMTRYLLFTAQTDPIANAPVGAGETATGYPKVCLNMENWTTSTWMYTVPRWNVIFADNTTQPSVATNGIIVAPGTRQLVPFACGHLGPTNQRVQFTAPTVPMDVNIKNVAGQPVPQTDTPGAIPVGNAAEQITDPTKRQRTMVESIQGTYVNALQTIKNIKGGTNEFVTGMREVVQDLDLCGPLSIVTGTTNFGQGALAVLGCTPTGTQAGILWEQNAGSVTGYPPLETQDVNINASMGEASGQTMIYAAPPSGFAMPVTQTGTVLTEIVSAQPTAFVNTVVHGSESGVVNPIGWETNATGVHLKTSN